MYNVVNPVAKENPNHRKYIHTFILFGGFNHAVSSPPQRERERLSQPTFQKYMI